MGKRRAYRTDLSDEEWALLEPGLAEWREALRVPNSPSVQVAGLGAEFVPIDGRVGATVSVFMIPLS